MAGTNKLTIVAVMQILATLASSQVPTQPGGLFVKRSPYGAVETINRLDSTLRAKGFTIIARVHHHINARNVNMTLRPTELIIFGNPAIGTRLMQAGQSIGIDLPMKALAYETEQGATWLLYNEG